MRKVVFGGANSLDNFIARKDDTVDWLLWNDEVSAIIAENWQRFDTVVMGRKTYEVGLRLGAKAYPRYQELCVFAHDERKFKRKRGNYFDGSRQQFSIRESFNLQTIKGSHVSE